MPAHPITPRTPANESNPQTGQEHRRFCASRVWQHSKQQRHLEPRHIIRFHPCTGGRCRGHTAAGSRCCDILPSGHTRHTPGLHRGCRTECVIIKQTLGKATTRASLIDLGAVLQSRSQLAGRGRQKSRAAPTHLPQHQPLQRHTHEAHKGVVKGDKSQHSQHRKPTCWGELSAVWLSCICVHSISPHQLQPLGTQPPSDATR